MRASNRVSRFRTLIMKVIDQGGKALGIKNSYLPVANLADSLLRQFTDNVKRC